MNHNHRIATGALIILTILFVGKATAQAYTVENLSVDQKNDFVLEPGKAELDLNPGETVTRDIYVTDRIPGTTHFKVEVEDIRGSDDPDRPVIIMQEGEKGPNSGKDYIHPDTTTFSLNFGQRITIPVTVTIPGDAQPGGYYSSVLVSNEPSIIEAASTTAVQSMTKVISRVGTLLFIRVNGQANESGQVQDFRIKDPQPFFYEKGPFTFEILFNNDGNVHLVPYGTVTIKNTLGKTVTELPVDAYFSLPNSLRYRDVTWDMPMLLGRYTATLSLNRGYGNVVDTKTIVFWVIPWKIVLSVFAGILIIILIITYFLRTFELRKKD